MTVGGTTHSSSALAIAISKTLSEAKSSNAKAPILAVHNYCGPRILIPIRFLGYIISPYIILIEI